LANPKREQIIYGALKCESMLKMIGEGQKKDWLKTNQSQGFFEWVLNSTLQIS